MKKVIQIDADGPARIAQRIVARLARDGLLFPGELSKQAQRVHQDQVTEAIADEVHQDAVDATLGRIGP